MYFAAGESLEMVMSAAAATTNPSYTIAYNDIQSTGMVLPQSSSNGALTGTSFVTALTAPAAGTTRQLAHFTLYNSDTAKVEVIIRKDVSGTDYPFKKVILPVGATLEYSRETGWNVITTQTAYVFSEFTSNGTWTKPLNMKFAWIVVIGAGGGGGSGRSGALGTNRTGGGGGAGGGCVQMFLENSQLSESSYSVVVGTGGVGGAAQTVASTNGNAGTTGGNSSFGSLMFTKGGGGGFAGTNATTVSGGSAPSNIQNADMMPLSGPYSYSGGSGGVGATNSTGSGGNGMASIITCGGTGGTGLNTSNVGITSLSTTGGRPYFNGCLTTSLTSFANATALSNVNCAFFKNPYLFGTIGVGEGGYGGVSITGFTNGQNAGNYGSGGGGGVGVLDGTGPSGAGGNGAGGMVTVLEIY